MLGYYIHNQIKDGSGVSKKIEAQIQALSKHFEMRELYIEKQKEHRIQKKIRQKLLKQRPKLLYKKAFDELENPDFVYVRKQILDEAFLGFLVSIKKKYPECITIMEVPTYPYWNEFPDNRLGKKMIVQEKATIPYLKRYVDTIVDVGDEKNLFDIKTINIRNGINFDTIKMSDKIHKSDDINLIAVAKWRDVHGYERVINSLIDYYKNGGTRDIKIHMVGDGPETAHYKRISDNEYVKDKVIFYGLKSGKELDDIYDKADVGLGVFAFYRTGGKYVSTLKGAEYLAKGLPVVSAMREDVFFGEGEKYFLGIADDESKVDMSKIIKFYDDVYSGDLGELHREIRGYAVRMVSMEKRMEPVIDEIRKAYEKIN